VNLSVLSKIARMSVLFNQEGRLGEGLHTIQAFMQFRKISSVPSFNSAGDRTLLLLGCSFIICPRLASMFEKGVLFNQGGYGNE